MRQNKNFRLGFFPAGGWDTDANQSAAMRGLAKNLEALANTLAQLRHDSSVPKKVVVVLSEFGRTTAENGTPGKDSRHERRDRPMLSDYGGAVAQVLHGIQDLSVQEATNLSPGLSMDKLLDGLMGGWTTGKSSGARKCSYFAWLITCGGKLSPAVDAYCAGNS